MDIFIYINPIQEMECVRFLMPRVNIAGNRANNVAREEVRLNKLFLVNSY